MKAGCGWFASLGTKNKDLVYGADGSLTGYGGGLPRKQWLLAHEGAAFKRLAE